MSRFIQLRHDLLINLDQVCQITTDEAGKPVFTMTDGTNRAPAGTDATWDDLVELVLS